ncbi:MAG TPA: hypothetical protein VG714_10545 [Acidobacteriaceae bacterium]|nr:hypothetical protein [Acidobacteriaceae bacterium]
MCPEPLSLNPEQQSENILCSRRAIGLDRYDFGVLCLYLGVVGWGIWHHLACMDEAQAWLIARDSGLGELLFRRLHYEGAPALWPLMLWGMARLHLPYTAINWLGGALAAMGTILLLRHAPFPRVIRWLLPFTFFLAYQYAVIARSYVLLPALLFGLAILYSLQRSRPVLFAVVAGLLANISAHGAIVACVLMAMYLVRSRRVDREGIVAPTRRRAVVAGVFGLMLMTALVVAFPAPDGAFPKNSPATRGRLHAVLLKLIGPEPSPVSTYPPDPPLEKSPIPGEAGKNSSIVAHAVDYLVPRLVLTMNAATYPIAESNLLALTFYVGWGWWLWSRRQENLLVVYFAAIFLSCQIWIYSHHSGLFLLLLITLSWIVLETSKQVRGPRWLERAFGGICVVVVVLQVGWTTHCLYAEARGPYDPGLATARFLEHAGLEGRAAGFGFETVSAQPYAVGNLYFNWPHSYYLWSTNADLSSRRTEVASRHPAAVVVAEYIDGREDMLNQWMAIAPPGRLEHTEMTAFWQARGYRETHRFCGDRYMRMGVANTVCEVVLEPLGPR